MSRLGSRRFIYGSIEIPTHHKDNAYCPGRGVIEGGGGKFEDAVANGTDVTRVKGGTAAAEKGRNFFLAARRRVSLWRRSLLESVWQRTRSAFAGHRNKDITKI